MNQLTKLEPKLLNVGIIGFTGEAGKTLTKIVLKNNIFKSHILIGRRKVDYDEDFYQNGTQKVVDFDNLAEHEEAFKGLDVLFCCLGTKTNEGEEKSRKVEYGYTVESAKLAKKNGCKQVHLVSAPGASKTSRYYMLRIKGDIEEALSNMQFEKTSFYRPIIIVSQRPNRSIGEAFFQTVSKPFQIVAPRLFTCPAETLAKAIINNSIYQQQDAQYPETVDNSRLFDLAKLNEWQH